MGNPGRVHEKRNRVYIYIKSKLSYKLFATIPAQRPGIGRMHRRKAESQDEEPACEFLVCRNAYPAFQKRSRVLSTGLPPIINTLGEWRQLLVNDGNLFC